MVFSDFWFLVIFSLSANFGPMRNNPYSLYSAIECILDGAKDVSIFGFLERNCDEDQ